MPFLSLKLAARKSIRPLVLFYDANHGWVPINGVIDIKFQGTHDGKNI